MWPFSKKEDTVESLMKDCNDSYHEFDRTLTLGHYGAYVEFKMDMKESFEKVKEAILSADNDERKKALLNHFKKQLTFFEKNPFSCEGVKLLDFKENNFPYVEKMEMAVQEYLTEVKKNKRGVRL